MKARSRGVSFGRSRNFLTTARAASVSCSAQSGWLKVIASPQSAIMKSGSSREAARNSSRASSYQNEWSAATPRTKCSRASFEEVEAGNSTAPSFDA
ncbi:MAG: hypothetical protein LC774_01920 [Acidobacteria bacterium]|nr:hypothetical protein [Acidobacteriota bacterium]